MGMKRKRCPSCGKVRRFEEGSGFQKSGRSYWSTDPSVVAIASTSKDDSIAVLSNYAVYGLPEICPVCLRGQS